MSDRRSFVAAFIPALAVLLAAASSIQADEDQKKVQLNPTDLGIGYSDYDVDGTLDIYLTNYGVGCNYQAIGLTVEAAEEALQTQLGLRSGQGVVVTTVVDGGPAAKAGIQRNDLILAVNRKPIGGSEELLAVVSEAGDQDLSIELLRSGEKTTVTMTPNVSGFVLSTNFIIGVTVAPVDPTLRAQLRLPKEEGLVVTQVQAGMPAAKAGMKVHDIVLRLNNEPVAKREDLQLGLAASAGKEIPILLLSGGARRSISVTPENSKAGSHYELNLRNNFLQRNVVQPNATWFNYTLRPSILNEPPASTAPATVKQQLEVMTEQVERLREAVESLRAVVEESPPSK